MTRKEWEEATRKLDREWAAYDKFLKFYMGLCIAFLATYPVVQIIFAWSNRP